MDITDQFGLHYDLIKKEKKKCHGNRRLQRFRRNYRKQGLNDQTIEMLVGMHQAIESVQQNAQIKDEEKLDADYSISDIDQDSNMLLSSGDRDPMHQGQHVQNNFGLQLSTLFEQPSTTRKWISPLGRLEHKKIKYPVPTTDHWQQSAKLIPHYLHMYPRLFIHLLSKAIPCHRRRIEEYLSNSELLQFMQQRAHLLCTFFQLKIEEDYWNFVNNLITPLLPWIQEFTKNMMKQNSINWDHTKTEANIKYRQNIIENKLQQATNQLFDHMQRSPPYSLNSNMYNETNRDQHVMTILYDALTVLIRNGLHYFLMNFHQKKVLLNIDVYDVQLLKSFYDLNPSEKQIRSVQDIWRLQLKSSKRVIRQQKKHIPVNEQANNEFSVVFDQLTTTTTTTINNGINDFYLKHDHQEDGLSSSDLLTPAMCLIAKARLNNIEERTRHILDSIDVRSE